MIFHASYIWPLKTNYNHMKRLFLILVVALISTISFAQVYQFTDVKRIPVTPVKNQASTGTCWCFATTAFIEAELMRMGKGEFDLSEMFIVRQNYLNRMEDNFMRRGKGNLGQGSLSHMMTKIVAEHGLIPEEIYNGINYNSPTHSHGELNKFVNTLSTTSVELRKRSPEYYKLVNALFDTYLGPVPAKFNYKGKEYTPITFVQSLGLNMNDYVEITSFSHKPFYSKFVVEVPDNWDHELYYNVPLNEMMEIMDYAINNGYTIAWDGDVSERSFSHAKGVAIFPEVDDMSKYEPTDRDRFETLNPADKLAEIAKFEKVWPEKNVTQEIRQQGYEGFTTTDDHLMLLTGIVKDQNGTKYYITKNSWGTERNTFGGYLNMSENYVKAKTIAIMVHKNSIPAAIRAKLGL